VDTEIFHESSYLPVCHFTVMGYKQVQELYKKRHGKFAKSSWIANILDDHGKTKSRSPKRTGDYKYPCPKAERNNLEKILKELKML
jgi:hypothetical protein